MASTLDYKLITDTVDLRKQKTAKFKIQEPPDNFFYKDQIKLTCLKLDTGEPTSKAKPGKITAETTKVLPKNAGKEAELVYAPEASTFPGEYQIEVIFRGNGRTTSPKKTLSAKFNVIDTTPIAIYDLKGKNDYNIDLSDSGNSWKAPVKLKVEGPRNQEIQLDLATYPVSKTHFGIGQYDPKLTGKFDKKVVKLTGNPAKDTVLYYPGDSAICSDVVATAHSKKATDKAHFTFHFKDIDCAVYYYGMPIGNEQTLAVELEHSLGTAFFEGDGKFKYTTTDKYKFTFIGPRNSSVLIDMKWNGYDSGHKHDPASYDKLATGYFSGFKQVGSWWEPGGDLIQADGIVNFRNLDYVTYGLSGTITVTVNFSYAKLARPLNERFLAKSIKFYLRVGYWGLIKFDAGASDNIKLVGKTGIHPDNHYGTMKLFDAIKAIAKAYGEACDEGKFDIDRKRPEGEDKMLHVNDMSLKYGGRFDCEHDTINGVNVSTKPFKPGHSEHMFGEEVDISIKASKMNSKQEAWFNANATAKKTVTRADGTTESIRIFGFIRAEYEGDHFHCSLVPKN